MNEQINAFCNLLLYGSEKVPYEMLGCVFNTPDFTLYSSFLAYCWLAGPPGQQLLSEHCREANGPVTIQFYHNHHHLTREVHTPPDHDRQKLLSQINHGH